MNAAGPRMPTGEMGNLSGVTFVMAVSIGWGVFLLELVALGAWIARHHR